MAGRTLIYLANTAGRQSLERGVRIGRERPSGGLFLCRRSTVSPAVPKPSRGAQNAGSHRQVGNPTSRKSGQPESPSQIRPGACTGSTAGAWKSSQRCADSVRPVSAGRWLGKTRAPAETGRNTCAAATPFCGQSLRAEFAIRALVRTSFVM